MKTECNLKKSAKARLNETIRRAGGVGVLAEVIRDEGFHPDRMAALRLEAEKLLQAIHEYNAYNNVISE